MRSPRYLLRLMTTVAGLSLSGSLAADTPAPPRSYTQVAGNYLFVMLAEGAAPLHSSTGHAYPSSGLYNNDGSVRPIWTVEWYAFEVYVSPDGRHLVEMGPWPTMKGQTRDLSVRALAFYEDGRPLKEYDIGDLVQTPDILPQSASHFQWKKQVIFDGVAGRLAVRTLDGQTYKFDVATGVILEQHLETPKESPGNE